MNKQLIFLALLLLIAATAPAQPYKWVNEYGQTCYGDVAPEGVPFERCFVPPPPPPDPYFEQRIRAMRQYADELAARRLRISARQYDRVVVTHPRDGGFVREEGKGINVSVSVMPELRLDDGHLIQVLLDGNPYGEGSTETTQNLRGVDRGRHTLVAQVVDSTGTTLLRSAPVSFHYQVEARLHTAPYYLRPKEPVPPEWSPHPFPPVVPPTAPGGAGASPYTKSPARQAPRAPNVPPARRTHPPPPTAAPTPPSPPPTGGGLTR